MEPETGASLRLPALANLWQNAVYFGQGLAFPVAPLGTPLANVLPLDEYWIVAAINLIALVGLWALFRWGKQQLLFWYAMSWFVVGVLPLWLMLDFAYVITSPRLLYLGGAGSAMLWAGAVILLWVRQPARWWLRAVAIAVMTAVLAFSMVYVRDKMQMAQAVTRPIWQIVEAAQRATEEAAGGDRPSMLVLNAPSWAAPRQPAYRIGTEGLTFIPEYVRVQDSVYVNGGVEPRVRAFMYDPVKEEWTDYIGYAGDSLGPDGVAGEIRRADAVYIMGYGQESLRLEGVGGLERAPELAGSGDAVATFGEDIALVDHALRLEGPALVVTLWWRIDQVPEGNVTVFLHVYDDEGNLVAQKDGAPLSGLFPPQYWLPGDVIRDVRWVFPEAQVAPGTYTVAAGWYDADTGQRLPVASLEGLPESDGALRLYELNLPAIEGAE
jgi:hypothetical protein